MKLLINVKKISLVFLACFVGLSTVGCQAFRNATPYERIESSIPYLRSSSWIITNSLLSYAVSEEDRVAKAQIVFDVASLVENLTQEEDLSPEQLIELIDPYVPDKSHWSEFVANIVLLYADFHAQVRDWGDEEKRKLLREALNKIASGCKGAASVIID